MIECEPGNSQEVLKVFEAPLKNRNHRHDEKFLEGVTSESTSLERAVSASLRRSEVQDSNTVIYDSRRRSKSLVRSRSRGKGDGSPVLNRRTRGKTSLALNQDYNPDSSKRGDVFGQNLLDDDNSYIYAFLEDALRKNSRKHRHARRRSREERQDHARECADVQDEETGRHDEHADRRHGSPAPTPAPAPARRDRRADEAKREQRVDNELHREFINIENKSDSLPQGDHHLLIETFAKLCAHLKDTDKSQTILQYDTSYNDHSLRRDGTTRQRCDVEEDEHQSRILSGRPSRNQQCRRARNLESAKPSNSSFRNDRRYMADNEKYNPRLDTIPSAKYMNSDSRDLHCRYQAKHGKGSKFYGDDKSESDNMSEVKYASRRNSQNDQSDHRNYRDERDYANRSIETIKQYDDYREADLRRKYDKYSEGYDRRGHKSGNSTRELNERRLRDHYSTQSRTEKRYSKRDFDRQSIVSRDYEKYSDRDDHSISAGSTTLSEKSCLKVVKKEIAEQREAMDKMMKLWIELMRCFKTLQQNPPTSAKANKDAVENANAHLQLWRECMRRYETVAKDVGDTDQRLKEELQKQKSEMAEMSQLWQECLKKYREMTDNLNALKKQMMEGQVASMRVAAPGGEGPVSHLPYAAPPLHNSYTFGPPVVSCYNASPVRAPLPGSPVLGYWSPTRAPPPHRRQRHERSPSPHTPPRRKEHSPRRHHKSDRDEPKRREKSKARGSRSEHRRRK